MVQDENISDLKDDIQSRLHSQKKKNLKLIDNDLGNISKVIGTNYHNNSTRNMF